jgi:hypothetical protein
MDNTTSDNLDQADADILTPTVSDEAIEAAAGIERAGMQTPFPNWCPWTPAC